MGVSPCNVRAREQTGFFVTRIIQDGAFLPHRHERKFFTMKRKLTAKEYTYVASMLFGLFFGAPSTDKSELSTSASVIVLEPSL